MGPSPIIAVLYRRKIWTRMYKEKGHMKTEGGIRAVQFAVSKREIQKADGVVLI